PSAAPDRNRDEPLAEEASTGGGRSARPTPRLAVSAARIERRAGPGDAAACRSSGRAGRQWRAAARRSTLGARDSTAAPGKRAPGRGARDRGGFSGPSPGSGGTGRPAARPSRAVATRQARGGGRPDAKGAQHATRHVGERGGRPGDRRGGGGALARPGPGEEAGLLDPLGP